MEKQELERWSVVRLISGGPNMTVTDPKFNGCVRCNWFNFKGNLKSNTFNRESLEIVPYPSEKTT